MIDIAILGHGVVGTGTARMIEENREQIAAAVGDCVNVKYILDIRELPDSPWADRIVHDYDTILADPSVKLVAEVIGGSHPAFEFQMRAMEAGKSVVTSNKEVVSVFGDKLTACAAQHGVSYGFEASCGGGIPLISVLSRDLSHNRIDAVSGILNGTTNFILTGMFAKHRPFSEMLAEAQRLGYAEKDPTADVEGIDARRKINIINACLTGKLYDDSAIPSEGISGIRSSDVSAAEKAGYSIKLIANISGEHISVAPRLVPADCPLSHVDGVFNALLAHGNFVDDVMLYGRGAGADATASAVVADIVAALRRGLPDRHWQRAEYKADTDSYRCSRYIACDAADCSTAEGILGSRATRITAAEGEAAYIVADMSEAEIKKISTKINVKAIIRVL